jgi:hypothetical protein
MLVPGQEPLEHRYAGGNVELIEPRIDDYQAVAIQR